MISAPEGRQAAQRALHLLRKGGFLLGAEWDEAHALCQQREGSPACDQVHGLAHWIEGDLSNRDYWYARAGAQGARAGTIEEEWQRLNAMPG